MTILTSGINGYCPLGCGRTLDVDEDGNVFCNWAHCPNPTAVYELLQDREVEHIVTFDEDGFIVRHPLRERLGDALMDCVLHEDLAAMSGPPARPGRYRVTPGAGDVWSFATLGEGSAA